MSEPRFTPLCPAGHLPLKGGDQAGRFRRALSTSSEIGSGIYEGLISPLEGEMSGRTEGGSKGHGLSFYCFKPLVEAA
jgi:hypothetical protein